MHPKRSAPLRESLSQCRRLAWCERKIEESRQLLAPVTDRGRRARVGWQKDDHSGLAPREERPAGYQEDEGETANHENSGERVCNNLA